MTATAAAAAAAAPVGPSHDHMESVQRAGEVGARGAAGRPRALPAASRAATRATSKTSPTTTTTSSRPRPPLPSTMRTGALSSLFSRAAPPGLQLPLAQTLPLLMPQLLLLLLLLNQAQQAQPQQFPAYDATQAGGQFGGPRPAGSLGPPGPTFGSPGGPYQGQYPPQQGLNASIRLDYYSDPALASARQSLMYPYDFNHLTDISSGKSILDQPLQFRLPFFGFSFEYIWLQRDGYITFNKGMQTYRFPLKLPVQPTDTFVQEDPSLIAPFFAMQDIAPETPGAGVYFRIVNLADPMGYYDPEYNLLRDRILLDFREGMIGASDFVPKYALIATWRNMTVANRRTERPLRTNTYQAVIATDEIRTYAMFNYEQIEWITHQDNYDGLKGAAAFVGFNAGNTTRAFEFKPYSQHQRVSLLPSGGFGNNLRGRYYFQVDEEVWPGACIDKKLEPNLRDRLPLTFFPRYGHMLGGTAVDVTGPCLDPTSIIFCRFDNFKAEAVWRDTNRATCISPPFMYHGYVDLTISVDQRIEFVGRFYIQPPDVAEEDVIVLDGADRQEAPQELELKWRPQKLSWRNDTSVTISLWGYRETMNVYPSLTYITTLVPSARLGQSTFRLDLSMFRDRDDQEFQDMLFGFIAVNLTQPALALGRNMRQSPVIWSRPMPLAWYFRPQWLRNIGHHYKDYFCDSWHERESFADRFAASVWRCPCTLKQVMIDKGRFAPDLQCNIIDRRCDTFHREALHCVTTGRPSVGGSGQTCCYDDQGELIQTADTIYGGRPARAFPYGKHPFKIRMMIPTLSTWVHDVAPYFYCCLWQKRKDNAQACQNFNYFRTSQDCSLYQAPVVGSVYGDPHMITFNKNNYTFNGRGEYVLVHTDDPKVKFDVQARFEQVPRRFRNLPSIPATQLTAVAAQDNFSSVVEFRIRPLAARWRYHMYVIVDNEYIFWWDKSMQVQNFRGVTLYQPAGIQNMSHIIAMFDSGAGVEVMSMDGYMTTHVYLPADFQGVTGGLLGNYSRRGLQPYDLVTPTGTRFGAQVPVDRLHRDFGQAWRLTEQNRQGVGKTIFSHSSLHYSMYDDPRFVPVFEMPPSLPPELYHLQPELDSICSDAVSCIYDYVVSYGNRDLALATKRFEALAHEIISTASLPVVRCPALPKPANGMKTENRYWPGQTVRFSCDVGYRLVGYEARFCRQDGLWSWGEDAQCIPEWRYFLIMFGSIMAAFLPMAVTIAAGVFCLLFMVRRSRAHYTGEPGGGGGDDLSPDELGAATGARGGARALRKRANGGALVNRSRRSLNNNENDDDDDDDKSELVGSRASLDRARARAARRRADGNDDAEGDDDDADDLDNYGERAPRATQEVYEDDEDEQSDTESSAGTLDEEEGEDEDEDEAEFREPGRQVLDLSGIEDMTPGAGRQRRRRPAGAGGDPADERRSFLAGARQRPAAQQPRSLFEAARAPPPEPRTVYSPGTSTSPGRFGPAVYRPFQPSGGGGAAPTASAAAAAAAVALRQQQQQPGLPAARPGQRAASQLSDPDYGPLREARI